MSLSIIVASIQNLSFKTEENLIDPDFVILLKGIPKSEAIFTDKE